MSNDGKTAAQLRCEESLRDIGEAIKASLSPGLGATLIVFSYGDDGFMTFLSTAERTGTIATLRELAAKLEREITPGGAS